MHIYKLILHTQHEHTTRLELELLKLTYKLELNFQGRIVHARVYIS